MINNEIHEILYSIIALLISFLGFSQEEDKAQLKAENKATNLVYQSE